MRRCLFLLGGKEYRASAPDKNKAVPTGQTGVLAEKRHDGIHNEIVASQRCEGPFPPRWRVRAARRELRMKKKKKEKKELRENYATVVVRADTAGMPM